MRFSSLLVGCLALVPCTIALPIHQITFKPPVENEKRLITTFDHDQGTWMTETQILELIQAGKRFMDITDGDLDKEFVHVLHSFVLPNKPRHQTLVKPLLDKISISFMKDFLTTFSGFRTRYYKSPAGKESGKWLFDQVSDIALKHGHLHHLNVTVEQFEHAWGQHSVIARIQGDYNSTVCSGDQKDHVVIVGAHQDSINQWNPWFGRAPGADDDGSGSTTILQAFKLILDHGIHPCRPLEFHWYSAEEGGLLGSQKVAAFYREHAIPVAGMFQTGYQPDNRPPVIGVSTDYVDADSTAFLRLVIQEYCQIPWTNTKCGYGCSDHASWNKAGYPSLFTFETDFNDHSPYIHTLEDTIEHVSFEHMGEFVKAVLGWAIEMTH